MLIEALEKDQGKRKRKGYCIPQLGPLGLPLFRAAARLFSAAGNLRTGSGSGQSRERGEIQTRRSLTTSDPMTKPRYKALKLPD